MSDSDDDLPISELIKKRKRLEEAKLATLAAAKKATAEKKSGDKPERAAAPRNSSSSSSSGNKAADFYTDTLKGQLVQNFLVRWWYAMDWPKPEDIGEAPSGYETLDGFPGVFISTRVGRIVRYTIARSLYYCSFTSDSRYVILTGGFLGQNIGSAGQEQLPVTEERVIMEQREDQRLVHKGV
jgi:hypothetical protein